MDDKPRHVERSTIQNTSESHLVPGMRAAIDLLKAAVEDFHKADGYRDMSYRPVYWHSIKLLEIELKKFTKETP